ncbi:TrkH family potassium uptake protein [Marinitenerispora sediminis]|uniref:ATPase n=1 Tax=Marinitenerispora sediminis TaxID=1931232 RepID=A0A368T858_9ACTN|nr:potassium transporter TrkG [Marinitenerispora sediminis]RCV52025.1 ATPase [Marinitenerispora sediminis]RCV56932.1 ATPase [Marinitenerispora sediminis]RCV60072.1 ATPase [Marinitenerispora sediminis]
MRGTLRAWRSRWERLRNRDRVGADPFGPPRSRAWQRPAQLVVAAFALVTLVGTALLMLPIAHEGPKSTSLVQALFTAVSAVCVAGLAVVDTGQHWSTFGEIVILALIKTGGVGIMTLASVLGMVVIRRFGLRMQLSAQAETRSLNLGDVRSLVARIFVISTTCEVVVSLVLTLRLWTYYEEPFGQALYHGVFHGVAAFNNAGLALYSDSLTRFAADPVILLPVAAAIVLGSLGFPVLLEMRRHIRQPRRWSLHTKLTLTASSFLLVAGIVAITVLEWSNPATLGAMSWPQKLLTGVFHGVMPRSGGFNVVDVGQMDDSTLFVTIMLMFVGGGSAGTAGGIKATTFAVIFVVVWAEIRGHPDVHAFGRRLSGGAIRQALSLTFLSMTVVAAATVYLLITTPFPLEQILFEVVSAFGVVGLSTGITPELPGQAQVLLVLLMFAGRIGPITFASALALRERTRRYDLPEARPIIG